MTASERICTWAATLATLTIVGLVLLQLCFAAMGHIRSGHLRPLVDDLLILLMVAGFAFSQLVYESCRLGYLKRLRAHRPATRGELEAIYDSQCGPLAILVPSYFEPPRMVRRSLMAAALMEYPDRRVTLLIDNPPKPSEPETRADLKAMHELPGEIGVLLGAQERRYAAKLDEFQSRCAQGRLDLAQETRALAAIYLQVARWMENQAEQFEVNDHLDGLFVRKVLLDPAQTHGAHAEELISRCYGGRGLSQAELLREYKRLSKLFAVRLTSFERKQFVNLSHVRNKAMNVNSYLALIGRSLRSVFGPDGVQLEDCPSDNAELCVPEAEYVIVVDADTLLSNDYAMRLTHVLAHPANERVGIVQSPSVPPEESARLVERMAGAQSHIQRVVNLGLTNYGASFWVGSNALFRHQAFEDICEVTYERGYPIRKYIRDRTLVEDTESTIDFLSHGWRIYSYLDPLAHAAEPPDFGALAIQRLQWSGGGILNLPKLIRYLWHTPDPMRSVGETMLRLHYVSSIAISLGILVVPFLALDMSDAAGYWWLLPLLPYYFLHGRDLVLNGYQWVDLPRVLALNMLLLPVNVSGLIGAFWRRLSGTDSTFVRTPKATGRTAVPALYLLAAVAMAASSLMVSSLNLLYSMWGFAALGSLNFLLLAYALVRYIGIREAWQDLAAHLDVRWKPRAVESGRLEPGPDRFGLPVGENRINESDAAL